MNNLFKRIVEQHSSDIALKFGNQSATYHELDLISDKIAQLIIDCGLSPKECPFIGLYSSRTLYTIPMMLGMWKAGFAYVPMDPKFSSERIDYILDDCKLQLILTDCVAPTADYPLTHWMTINESVLNDVHPTSICAEHL